MEKHILEKDLWLYTFKPLSNKHFPFNILALVHGEQVLLIDTGFEEHAREYLSDLRTCGKTVTKVIVSHYHPDHVYGLREMENIELLGSSRFEGSFVSRDKDFNCFIPDHPVEAEESFSFGDFFIRLLPMPGHDVSTLWVEINRKWLFIGDDLMSANDGHPILPAISHRHVDRQMHALEEMKAYAHWVLIPAHGVLMTDPEKIIFEIGDRQIYLSNILNSKRLLTYEEAVEGCVNDYLHREWHANMHKWE